MIHDNLEYNVNANMPAITQVSNGNATAEVLDWSDPESWLSRQFEVRPFTARFWNLNVPAIVGHCPLLPECKNEVC